MNSQQATQPVRRTGEEGKVKFYPRFSLSLPQGVDDTVTYSLLTLGKVSVLPSTN